MFAKQNKALLDLNEGGNIKILEIGCGPGALVGALHRWYSDAEVMAVDQDSEFTEIYLWCSIVTRVTHS